MAKIMYCAKCGSSLANDGTNIRCPKCGGQLIQTEAPDSMWRELNPSTKFKCIYCNVEKEGITVKKYSLNGGDVCEECAKKLFSNGSGFIARDDFEFEINELEKLDIRGINDVRNMLNHEAARIQNILTEQKTKAEEKTENIIVSTGDINRDYEIIGPVFFRGNIAPFFTSKMVIKYKKMFPADSMPPKEGYNAPYTMATGNGMPFLCFEKIKKVAANMGADAVINVKLDIQVSDGLLSSRLGSMMDANLNHIELIYGTAVKFKD